MVPSVPRKSSLDAQLADQMAPHHPVSAWMMSLVLHSSIFVTLALTLRFAPRGVALEPDRNVGIVLVHEREGQREYFDGDSDQAEQPEAAASRLESVLPTEKEIPIDLTGAMPEPAELSSGGLGDAIIDATQLTSGGRPKGGIDGGTSTEVFGVTGYGSKFVYVFDRSGSMDGYGGRPLKAAKLELLASLQDLDRTHQFQIIFYNERPTIFKPNPGTPQLVWGDERGKQLAKEFVNGITASGGTRHKDALQLALRMRPDAIFFLTDADEPQLTSGELAEVRRWNQQTMIHAIEFGFGPQSNSNNFLVRLARQNGGQHAYVDISRLGLPR